MRVLHIDTGHAMRGGQWQALHLMQGLAGRGVVSRLLAPEDSGLFEAATALGVDVRPLRAAHIALDAGHFDLIHAHDARAHTLGLVGAKRLIVSRRVAFPVRRSPLSKLKYRCAQHYLAVSEYVKQKLLDAGVEPSRITVVYDGVQLPEPVDEATREWTVALDSDDPGKGKAIVEEAAKLLGLQVYFSRSLVKDLPQAQLFVYITDSEGLGSAALLALAYGAPVIASRVGGLPEIVQHEHTGLLTDNAPESVARSIQRLLENRMLASQLACCGRSMVEQRFTVGHMVENTLRVYERTMS